MTRTARRRAYYNRELHIYIAHNRHDKKNNFSKKYLRTCDGITTRKTLSGESRTVSREGNLNERSAATRIQPTNRGLRFPTSRRLQDYQCHWHPASSKRALQFAPIDDQTISSTTQLPVGIVVDHELDEFYRAVAKRHVQPGRMGTAEFTNTLQPRCIR